MFAALSWFEIPVKEFYRARAFYEYVFQTELRIAAMGDYTMGFFPPAPPGGITGAIVQGEGYQPAIFGHRLYFNCGTDLQPFFDRALEAGGKPLVEKTAINGTGFVAFVLDPEGNTLALHSAG